jgi:hypothetical protein
MGYGRQWSTKGSGESAALDRIPYRCSLPGLTRFGNGRCTGPEPFVGHCEALHATSWGQGSKGRRATAFPVRILGNRPRQTGISGTPGEYTSREGATRSRQPLPRNVPRERMSVPRRRSNVPGERMSAPRRRSNVPRERMSVPRTRMSVPGRRTNVPRRRMNVPRLGSNIPRRRARVPGPRSNAPRPKRNIPRAFGGIPLLG